MTQGPGPTADGFDDGEEGEDTFDGDDEDRPDPRDEVNSYDLSLYYQDGPGA